MLCPPNPHNITPIYASLMDFIALIESTLKLEPGSHCPLYNYLMDYIKDVFIGQIRADNSDVLNEASIALDSWKVVTDVDSLRELNSKKPLLKVAILRSTEVD